MRPLEESRMRWRETLAHSATMEDLQRACKSNSASSPCVTGCRSVCWKTFILSENGSTSSWIQILRDGRAAYSKDRDRLLQFIKHPEALNDLAIDPLADDADSPWNTVREDEIIRSEIQQDVQRLPDEANYHDTRIQNLILDILFVYCKSNPSGGGYRQGMHELLAPILHVIEQDALDRAMVGDIGSEDETMLETLDSAYVEHDAYILFAKVMTQAQAFYEVQPASNESSQKSGVQRAQEQSSAIVERSKFIHEVCLAKVDPELAAHLTSIEILPQIFLIRWIRLLFSREFPFDQFLVLWDTIFAVDPKLESVDLICVAMLLRIRWQLLEADYSVCLQLLLKYPQPERSHGPHTFVDDALYLRGHLNTEGGATLITKYTNKAPTMPKSPDGSARPNTPSFSRFNSFRQRGLGVKSPLHSPSRYLQQQGGVEALFQGAAKGAKEVLERSEKLGINQAVRDAVGEIKRNVSNFNEARHVSQSPSAILNQDSAKQAFTALERRNKHLASMLDETVDSLKSLSGSGLEDKARILELIEVAAAKLQFVKVYLEDSSMDLPTNDPATEAGPGNAQKKTAAVSAIPEAADGTGSGDAGSTEEAKISTLNLSVPLVGAETKAEQNSSSVLTTESTIEEPKQARVLKPASKPRPSAPIPTRSTLAQSSFSWMLEPDESSPKSPKSSPAKITKSPPPAQHKKRSSNNASRERNAFLFGEVATEKEGQGDSDEIFGLEPLGKGKVKPA
ncbi:hypothetical protein NLU13_3083 [Sarocladium strictum]|uniref:Rab-GAP TBC domain-containing protein n=1 Tax=Sarocladium strictum TaxID=5046 RepID=A0AA39L9Z0_SARSR|nr:hypothetical protein NLU13_3083 [Sarocladium strictum]